MGKPVQSNLIFCPWLGLDFFLREVLQILAWTWYHKRRLAKLRSGVSAYLSQLDEEHEYI